MPHPHPSIRANSRGFTLIELMITVAIVAILASVAYPSYQQYIIRGKRAAAQAEMLDIANRQQQFLLSDRSYADKTTLEASGYGLPNEVSQNYEYDIEVPSGAVPTFTITFEPKGAQASDGDLTLDSQGYKARGGDPTKW